MPIAFRQEYGLSPKTAESSQLSNSVNGSSEAPQTSQDSPKKSALDAAMESYFGKEAMDAVAAGRAWHPSSSSQYNNHNNTSNSTASNWREQRRLPSTQTYNRTEGNSYYGSSFASYRSEGASDRFANSNYSPNHHNNHNNNNSPHSNHTRPYTSSRPSHINYERKTIKFKLNHDDPMETLTVKVRRINLAALQQQQ